MRKTTACKSLVVVALLFASVAGLVFTSHSRGPKPNRGWFILRWVEKPARKGPSHEARPEDRTCFAKVLSYEKGLGKTAFRGISAKLREGDVVAYWMSTDEARGEIVKGHLNKVGYRLLDYGHLAIVVRYPKDAKELRLFSSHSFKGAHTEEGLDTLRENSWDCYRLDKWNRVDAKRLREFVQVASKKAGHWAGYDFTGMFGIVNANLRPTKPKDIGREYHCSTVVVAALYYAGLELDAIQRGGMLDLVSPKQVITSGGRLIRPPEAKLKAEPSPEGPPASP